MTAPELYEEAVMGQQYRDAAEFTAIRRVLGNLCNRLLKYYEGYYLSSRFSFGGDFVSKNSSSDDA